MLTALNPFSSHVVLAIHRTPASSEWTQLCDPMEFAGQSMSLVSDPVHATLSSQICPEP